MTPPTATSSATRFAMPLLAFCVAMLTPVPPGLGVLLRYDYCLAPLVMAIGWRLACRRETGLSALAAWSILLHALLLKGLWSSGLSADYLMAGRLPVSDAGGYHLGALRLLQGQELTVFASRRPLFGGLLAGTMTLAGGSLPATLAAFALCFGLAGALLTRAARDLAGPLAAALCGTFFLLFSRRFVGVASSELLGLTLGVCGLCLLLRAAQADRFRDWAFGLAALSLGLNARAGAFFVLPAVWLWGAWRWRGASRRGVVLLAGLAAMACGFAASTLLRTVAAPPEAMGFSNFSTTLYGLLTGGDWLTVFRDHPWLAGLPEQQVVKEVYALCADLLRRRPLALAEGVARAWGAALFGDGSLYSFLIIPSPGGGDMRAFLGDPLAVWTRSPYLAARFACQGTWFVAAGAGLAASLAWWRGVRRGPVAGLLLAMGLGLWLSLPFAPPWDANQMRAHAVMVPLLALLAGCGLAWLHGRFLAKGTAGENARRESRGVPAPGLKHVPGPVPELAPELAPFLLAAILLAVALSGPLALRALGGAPWLRPEATLPRCQPPGEDRRDPPHGEDAGLSPQLATFVRLEDEGWWRPLPRVSPATLHAHDFAGIVAGWPNATGHAHGIAVTATTGDARFVNLRCLGEEGCCLLDP